MTYQLIPFGGSDMDHYIEYYKLDDLISQKINKPIIIILIILIMGLLLLSFLLAKNLKKLKKVYKKYNHLDLLRKTFINADRNLILLKDKDLKYLFVNKAFEDLVQKDSCEIEGKDDFELFNEEFATEGKKSDLAVFESMTVIVDKLKIGNKVLEFTKFPVKLPNNDYGVGANIRDITEDYNNKKQLLETVAALQQSQNKLQLVMDSVPEGIFGIDINGICTFCNKSCLKLLGYTSQEQIIGKNMHWLIHHSRRDETRIEWEDCRILSAFRNGKGVHVEDEVFWRADGSCFDVGYYSYPEYENGEMIGLVVTFLDITSRKEAEKIVRYNTYHDALTGLYNRRYLEEEINKIDIESNLPISVIMGDVNGLKQTNDIFGHAAGDMLIQEAAKIIKNNARSSDICIRTGGDEFLMILPKTDSKEAGKIADQIKEQFLKIRINSFHGSISLGYSTKTTSKENIILTIDNADSIMYSHKLLDQTKFNESAIKEIMDRLNEISPWEKEHSARVSRLSQQLGVAMDLSSSELRRLTDAAYYHDIGKIILEATVLNKSEMLTEKEMQIMRRHPVVGYRILSQSDKTLDIAKYVLSHHERWDGKGYPNRLKGTDIPKVSRIIALADSYDLMIHGSNYKKAMSKEEAIQELQDNAGSQFDPEIVDVLIELINSDALRE